MHSTVQSGPVILSGASGMLGGAVIRTLAVQKVSTIQLVRSSPAGPGQVLWHPASSRGIEDPAALEGSAAAIHLSGASLAGRRWTAAYRREIAESRIESTYQLSLSLARLRRPPSSLLVASAVGIYGNRGEEILSEGSAPGSGFLAEVCHRWEAAADPARSAGIRVVHLRFGVVLGAGQGALGKMLPAFRMGLGARLGSGRQWMSWIAIEDAVRAVLFALERIELSGPMNVTAPNPVTNLEFTLALAHQLRRPAVLVMPRLAVGMVFGQMGTEALLSSTRALPEKLRAAGFQFLMPSVEDALGKACR